MKMETGAKRTGQGAEQERNRGPKKRRNNDKTPQPQKGRKEIE